MNASNITREFAVSAQNAQQAIALCAANGAVCEALPARRGITIVRVRAEWRDSKLSENMRNFNRSFQATKAKTGAVWHLH